MKGGGNMNEGTLNNIISLFDGMTKDDWNTLRSLIDHLYDTKTIESGIRLNGLEIAERLRSVKY